MTLEQYHSMVDSGSLGPRDGVELIDGLLVRKMPKNEAHRRAAARLNRVLFRLLPPGWFHQMQDPITLSASEPEPDAAVIRGEIGDRGYRHPGVELVGLVVEIAESSAAYDGGAKLALYAREGIRQYWIVDVGQRTVRVLGSPRPEGVYGGVYGEDRTYSAAEVVPVVLDGLGVGEVSVSEIVGGE
jgi:Uma2 family endonuclease